MKIKCLFALSFILAFTFYSCNSQNPAVKTIGPNDFEKGAADPNAQVVDVRTPQEYAEKHIMRAVNIDYNDAKFEGEFVKLDKTKPVYIYCLSGGRSAKAADFAAKNGFTQVYNLDGGITAWMGEKKPLTTFAGLPPVHGMSFDDYLANIKKKDKLVLVDFSAVWCGPCKLLKPRVEDATNANKDKVELYPVDVDKNPEVANAMHINGIPLLVMYKQGKEVWRSIGLIEQDVITDKIKEFSN